MMKQLSTSPIMGLAFSAMFALSGCNNVQPVTADPTHNTQETVTSPHAGRQMTQCPPFNPEMNMCTMQYDPVCVKEKQANGTFVYRTAGNSCSACGKPEAVEYYEGECE